MKGVVKSVKKKLNKIWSKNRKNKNKNKSHQIEHHYYYPPPQRPPPPPPLLPPPPFNRECRHCCYCSTQPSAPPLPESSSSLWLEAEHNSINYGTFLAQPQEQQEEAYHEGEAYHARQTQTEEEEIAMVDSETVYGVPVLPLLPQTETRRRDRSRGVYSIGAYLFQCLCPCLRIRESNTSLN